MQKGNETPKTADEQPKNASGQGADASAEAEKSSESTTEVGQALDEAQFSLDIFFGDNTTLKIIVVLLVAFLIAFIIGKILAKIILKLTQLIAVQSDEATSEERSIRLRRVETYLSVGLVLLRFTVIVLVMLIAVALLVDEPFRPATAIGAGTVFFVLAAATVGVLLRDLTSGSMMIAEKWYSVGDFIRVEPFMNVKGVVEQMTLRSTKIRDVSGEVIWMHNQYIQAVSVTPGGKRSEAIDVFVDNLEQAKKEFETMLRTLRPGPTMLASPLQIVETEQISDKVWRITIVGETAPGQEWLLEDFFVQALKEASERNRHFDILYGPMVRYSDDAAERRFRRAVRVRRQ